MFQFKRNNELLETVEKQKAQISRYENRLRDLVSAYKSLQNEKQALEASVKALTPSHTASPFLGRKLKSHHGGSKLSISSRDSSRRNSVDISKQSSAQENTSHDDVTVTSDKDEEVPNEKDSQHGEEEDENLLSDDEKDAELERLRHQISTLTVSLSTVSEEKSKIVATYQAEKKKLKQETDARLTENKEEVEAMRLKKQEFEEELLLTKEKIRSQQEDREQEQSTQSIMLRELQKMLNDERTKCEQLSNELQESRKAVQKAELGNKKTVGNENQLKKLLGELEVANGKLKAARDEAKKPHPMVEKLQKEIIEIKAAHRIQLEKEHMRYGAAEQRLKQEEEESEDRVASLEDQITELSNQMGGYETSKTRSQILVRTLKERISQLEAENGILAKQAASASSRSFLSTEDGQQLPECAMDVEQLKQQIIKFKRLLKNAVQDSNDSMDVKAWMTGLDDKNDEDDYQKLYLESQQELRHLKDEFEKYKVRAQNVLKTKRDTGRENLSMVATQQQFQELKNELEEVRERHFHLRSHCDGLDEQQSKLIKDHGQELMRQHLTHQKEIEAEKEIYGAKILELEQEMRSQRERTVALLAEKDKEVQHLQAYTNACHREYQSEYGGMAEPKRQTSVNSDYVFYDSDGAKESTTTDSVAEIISQGTGHDTTMIHYAEQMARKDVSINGLRRHKKQLELQIRQLQDAIMMKDEKYSREIAALKERIDGFKRSKSRENANLEYLKNVMFQYLTTDKDRSARNRMLSAVTAILQFSPEENKKVLKKF